VTALDPEALRRAVDHLIPGARLVSCQPLGPPEPAGPAALGSGERQPQRLLVETPGGGLRSLVLRTASASELGRDRRADRAGEVLLAFDTFDLVPDHVRAVDVGLVGPGGLRSMREAGEAYLITTCAEGRLYADDLRALARHGAAAPLDLARAHALASWLARLHHERLFDPVAWRRAVRDLIGHGRGVFGLVDAYPEDTPGAPPSLLRHLEELVLEWRWRLRRRSERLCRIHGDFQPWHVVFGEGTGFTALDARGAAGDAADDVTALSMSYLAFALEAPGAWAQGFRPLWETFWQVYLAEVGHERVLEAAAPFVALRALVLGCPRLNPELPAAARHALLAFAERVLGLPRFEPSRVGELFESRT
jgi:Phosphotransferase enzyme family